MGTKNLFYVFLAVLLICCSPKSTSVKDLPSKYPLGCQQGATLSLDPLNDSIAESAYRANVAIGSAQSVLDAINGEQVGIEWHEFDYIKMISAAKSGNFVFVYFYSEICVACDTTEKAVFNDPELIKMINENFYAMRVDIQERPDLTPLYATAEGVIYTPTFLILMPTGVAMNIYGYVSVEDLKEIVKEFVSIREGWISAKR